MTNGIHGRDGTEPKAQPPVRVRGARASRVGPTGFGNGPVITVGVMVAGAMLFAGWGVTQLVSADDAAATNKVEGTTISASRNPGQETGETGSQKEVPSAVTLPDRDGSVVPDAYEKGEDKREKPDQSEDGSSTGRGDEAEASKPEDRRDAERTAKRETRVYIIQRGDTLTEISGETGVPVRILVEKNRIQNPNLIYAGASLLIPLLG